MTGHRPADRGLSPVIGAILIVAIVAILSVVIGSMVLGLTDETDSQPSVALDLEPTGDGVTYRLSHTDGQNLTGDRTRLIGAADEEVLHGKHLRAGDDVEIVPVSDELKLVWMGENTGHTLATFEVDPASLRYNPGTIDKGCGWVEQEINDQGDLDMSDTSAVCDVTADTNTGKDDIAIDLDTDSVLVGNIDTDGDVDVDSSDVVGGITTDADDITIASGSNIYGNVVAQPDTNIDIAGGSSVTGDVVVKGGSLSLDGVTITGEVYADDDDLSCSNTSIGSDSATSRGCSEYEFKDPAAYP
jgi:hypothetical protein